MTATILTGLTGTASAAPLSASEETLSAMMANVEEDLTFLYDRAGVVQAPLVFSSSLDPASMAYSYSMLTGSTYNGTPASLVASGNFDAASGQWNSNSSISLGTNFWSATGTTEFTGGAGYVTEKGDAYSFPWDSHPLFRLFPDGNPLNSSGLVAITLFGRVVEIRYEKDDIFYANDQLNSNYSLSGLFEVTGTNSTLDGTGGFVVTPTPESSSLLLLGSSIVGVGSLLRKRLLAGS